MVACTGGLIEATPQKLLLPTVKNIILNLSIVVTL